MRRVLPCGAVLAALAIGLLAALPVGAAEAARGEFRFFVVDCTSTRSHVAASNTARTALTITNSGTATIFLGSSGGPQVLTSAIGWPLHAGATIEYGRQTGDPTVAVECIISGAEALGQRVNVIEEY